MKPVRMEHRVLGPLEVLADGVPVQLGGWRQRTALAGLLLEADHAVSLDALVDLLWAEDPPGTARKQVRNLVAGIRRTLTAAGAPAGVIETLPTGYRLRATASELDLLAFERRAARGRALAAAGRLVDAADTLQSALELWRGAPLQGLSGAGVEAAATRLAERRLNVVEARTDVELALGRHRDLTDALAELVARHPLRERLRGQLMVALYRSGRQADALATYQEGRTILAEELGLEPGPELRRIEQQILTGQADGEPAAVPPAGEEGARAPRMLPPDIGDLTGREGEVARLGELLAPGSARPSPVMRVAVVSGMAGVGKSTLAVHVAHRLTEAFPDGQLYLNLRGMAATPLGPADALARLLRALGAAGAAGAAGGGGGAGGCAGSLPAGVDERAEIYRNLLAGRRVVVVLDDAVSEAQVRPLLPGAPTCAVVVTSRRRLTGLEGATVVGLDVLAPGAAMELLGRVGGPDRVAAEREDAERLVELCDRLPLAVRIAAARLATHPHWPVAHLVEILADERSRLDELAAGDLGVRASLASSYTRLGHPARRLLRLLARGDACLTAPRVVAALRGADAHQAAAALDELVLAHLVEVEVSGPGGVDRPRYRLRDLVRLYARERSAHGDPLAERTAAVRSGTAATGRRSRDGTPGVRRSGPTRPLVPQR